MSYTALSGELRGELLLMSSTVLIVHGNSSCADQIKALLADTGLQVIWSIGQEASCKTIRLKRPDLVLIDGDLVRDDPGLCQKLRSCSPENHLPIILLLPSKTQDISRYLCGGDVDDYILQPCSPDDFQARVLLRLSSEKSKRVNGFPGVDYAFLAGLSNLAVSELDTTAILNRVVDSIAQVIEVRRCSITMIREDDEVGYILASSDDPEANGLRIDLERYPEILETIRSGKPLVIDNICHHPLMQSVLPYIEKLGFNSILVLPMIDRQRIVGVLVLRTARSIEGFSEEETSFCQLVANVATSALRLAELRQSEQVQDVSIATSADSAPEDSQVHPRSALIGMAAHDLRVLVSVIDGYCLLLSESGDSNLSAEQHEFINGLMAGSRRLVDMANNLLDYSRIEAGRFELHFAPQDICSIIKSVHGEMLPLLQRRNIQMNIQSPVSEIPVTCDEEGVRRVCYNIVSNALKFTPDGGSIDLELTIDVSEASVSVRDNGPGIAPDLLSRLFEEYSTSPAPNGRPGNGLGLSICKKIVEAHHGRIWAESSLGQGSRFIFCLPL